MIAPKHIFGHYDEHGVWRREKFCFIQCPPDRCDCMPRQLNKEIEMSQKSEYEIAMEEFLAGGGVIQQIARGVQSETATTNFWGAPKKKAKVDDVDAEVDDVVEDVVIDIDTLE